MTGTCIRDINIIINDYRKICLEHFKIIPGNRIQTFPYQFKCKNKGCQRYKTNWGVRNRNESVMLLPKLLLTIRRKRRRITLGIFKERWKISLCHWICKRVTNTHILKILFYFSKTPKSNFTFIWPCIVTYFFIIKPTVCTNFPNLLRHGTLHVSGSSSAHHQEFIHCTLGIGLCHTGLKTTFEHQFHPGPAWNLSSNLYDIHQCRVYSE
jgi:hypothetical protein